MKQVHGWWFPNHETHLPVWMDNPKNKLVMNGRRAYQGKKQLAALKYCKRHRVALDVGGHIGLWSFNLVHEFAAVYAFEPVAEHRACFEKNLVGVSQHLHCFAFALGAEPGMISIATEKGSSGNSTVSGPGNIEMVTLDSLGIIDVDFIKIDCEGYEENVLRGGAETIKAYKPTIIVEQKRDMAAKMGLKTLGAVDFLKTLGYRVAEELSGDYIMVPQ